MYQTTVCRTKLKKHSLVTVRGTRVSIQNKNSYKLWNVKFEFYQFIRKYYIFDILSIIILSHKRIRFLQYNYSTSMNLTSSFVMDTLKN